MTRDEIVQVVIRQMLKEAGAAPSPFIADMAQGFVLTLARDIVASGVPYLLVEEGAAILCLKCGMLSHNPNDVEQKYCGNCRAFLGDDPGRGETCDDRT